MPNSQFYCTFYLDQLYLGVPVLSVQEVIRAQQMTTVPLAPPTIRGLMNLRGQIVTAIDLREQLGLAPYPDDATPMNVVVRTEDAPVSLSVDRIGDVLEIDGQASEVPPDALAPKLREVVDGVFKLQGQLLLTVDIEKMLAPEMV